VAVDSARSAIRLGAQKVTILYRRSREEMPAYEEEIEEAITEGVEIVQLGIPKSIIGDNDSVGAIEYIKAELGKAGEDGRRRPIPIDGSETKIDCDMVIVAIGQVATTQAADYSDGPQLTEWGTIKTDAATCKTTAEHIFSGGDCATGALTVIEAIAAGQSAAVNIDKLLGGTGNLPQDTGFAITKPDEETISQSIPRAKEKTIGLSQRKRGFAEVVLGLDVEQARSEAGMCLRCDLEES